MPDTFWKPEIVAAFAGFGGVVVGSLISWAVQHHLLAQRIGADEVLAERQFTFDKELAERKFQFDRNLIDWKRRTELAEQTLADFYKVKELFRSARQPFAFAGQGRTRPRVEGDENHGKDAIYAPFERLNKEFTFLSELHARRFQIMALFGEKAIEPFNVVISSYNELQYPTFALLNMKGPPGNLREKFESTIGWALNDKDPFQERIHAAVSEIETLCRPVLEVRPK